MNRKQQTEISPSATTQNAPVEDNRKPATTAHSHEKPRHENRGMKTRKVPKTKPRTGRNPLQRNPPANIQSIGDRLFDAGNYKAAKVLFQNANHNSGGEL